MSELPPHQQHLRTEVVRHVNFNECLSTSGSVYLFTIRYSLLTS